MLNLALLAESVFSRGLSIAVTGLVIVFFALFMLTLFLAAMPHLSAVLDHYFPAHSHGRSASARPHSETADDTAVLAAIGFVLHHEYEKTIRESKKSS